MRAFIISAILPALICVLIFTNCAYVSNTTDELLDILERESPIDEFEEKWKKSRGALLLSTDQEMILKIDALTESAVYYQSTNDKFDLDLSILSIKRKLKEINNFEKFSFANLF